MVLALPLASLGLAAGPCMEVSFLGRPASLRNHKQKKNGGKAYAFSIHAGWRLHTCGMHAIKVRAMACARSTRLRMQNTSQIMIVDGGPF